MLLITGATGNIGTPLVHHLAARGLPVRVLVRDPGRAPTLSDVAEVHRGDLEDPESLSGSFRGVDRGSAVVDQRVRKSDAGDGLLAPRARAAGEAIRHGLEDPATERVHDQRAGMAADAAGGRIRPGCDRSRSPCRHRSRRHRPVAAVVLAEEGHDSAEYTLTGPESLTTAEQVQALSGVLGRPIAVRDVSTPEEAVRSRYPRGASPELAAAVVEAWKLMRADTVGARTDTVAELIGRPPNTFRSWCRQHAGDFNDVVGIGTN